MLVGNKISLRHIEVNDTDKIVKWRNSNNVRKNFFIQTKLTIEQHYWWIENKVKTGEVVQFIIIDNNNGLDIGTVFLKDIDKKNMKAEYGIFIGEDIHRGKGFGSEAAKLICKYGFEKLNLHKIFLRVFENNIQAKKSYKKAGFEEEALLIDDICIEKNFYNVNIMSIIK